MSRVESVRCVGGPTDPGGHGQVRSRNLLKAVLYALIARFSGVWLQVVSLPVAAAALGPEGFTVYAMVTATMSWLTLSNVGIGPSLTVRLSSEALVERPEVARRAFATASLITFTITAVVALIALAILFGTPWATVVFRRFPAQAEEIVLSLTLVIGVFVATQLLSIIEAAQLGLQESYRLSLFTAAGTLVAVVAVFVAAGLEPRPSVVLLAVQSPMLAARLMNAVDFIRRNRTLAARPRTFDRRIARELVVSGLKFSAAGPLSNFLAHVAPIIIVGTVYPATYAAAFSAVMNAVIILASVFAITAGPLLGALPEARARGDMIWIRRMYGRVLITNVGYSLAIFAIFAAAGSTLFGLWYQNSLYFPPVLVALAGVYLVLLSLEVTHHTFLAGLGRVGVTSVFMVLRTGSGAVAVLLLADQQNAILPLQAVIWASVIFSTVPMSLVMLNQLRYGR